MKAWTELGINNDKKYKCVHISYPRINVNCHIELDYQTGLKFELLPVTNIHVKKNYLPGKYLGFKTVGKVNLIFPGYDIWTHLYFLSLFMLFLG
jgi:hypothetical protein